MKNRSAPPCAVIPVVAYPDVAAAAAAWLEAAFGFRVRLRIGDHRVQMWFGSAAWWWVSRVRTSNGRGGVP